MRFYFSILAEIYRIDNDFIDYIIDTFKLTASDFTHVFDDYLNKLENDEFYRKDYYKCALDSIMRFCSPKTFIHLNKRINFSKDDILNSLHWIKENHKIFKYLQSYLKVTFNHILL